MNRDLPRCYWRTTWDSTSRDDNHSCWDRGACVFGNDHFQWACRQRVASSGILAERQAFRGSTHLRRHQYREWHSATPKYFSPTAPLQYWLLGSSVALGILFAAASSPLLTPWYILNHLHDRLLVVVFFNSVTMEWSRRPNDVIAAVALVAALQINASRYCPDNMQPGRSYPDPIWTLCCMVAMLASIHTSLLHAYMYQPDGFSIYIYICVCVLTLCNGNVFTRRTDRCSSLGCYCVQTGYHSYTTQCFSSIDVFSRFWLLKKARVAQNQVLWQSMSIIDCSSIFWLLKKAKVAQNQVLWQSMPIIHCSFKVLRLWRAKSVSHPGRMEKV